MCLFQCQTVSASFDVKMYLPHLALFDCLRPNEAVERNRRRVVERGHGRVVERGCRRVVVRGRERSGKRPQEEWKEAMRGNLIGLERSHDKLQEANLASFYSFHGNLAELIADR